MSVGRKILRGVGIAGLVFGVLISILLIYITAAEYRPEDVKTVSTGQGSVDARQGMTLRIATLNAGYAALSSDSDFFMGGGSGVQGESIEAIVDNVENTLLGSA